MKTEKESCGFDKWLDNYFELQLDYEERVEKFNIKNNKKDSYQNNFKVFIFDGNTSEELILKCFKTFLDDGCTIIKKEDYEKVKADWLGESE